MKKLLLLSPFLFLFSCGPALYLPIANKESEPQENLIQGRKLYINTCGSCHQLYLPNRFATATWEKNLNEMQPKAKITDEQKLLIYKYLINAPKQ